MNESWVHFVVTLIVLLPILGCLGIGVPAWFGARLGERAVSAIVATAFAGAGLAAALALGGMLVHGDRVVEVQFGSWFAVGHYSFEWNLLADRLSVPFALFVALLTGVIGAFSQRYLHREAGFFRFYLLLAFCFLGARPMLLRRTGRSRPMETASRCRRSAWPTSPRRRRAAVPSSASGTSRPTSEGSAP